MLLFNNISVWLIQIKWSGYELLNYLKFNTLLICLLPRVIQCVTHRLICTVSLTFARDFELQFLRDFGIKAK